MARYQTGRSEAQLERAFLHALADGRDPPLAPTIQDIERYADAWADLVPADVPLRAELAHRLGQKYHFTRSVVPTMRAVLGVDEPGVDAAYRRMHQAPIASIFADRLRLRDRLRWYRSRLAARLESLPPFWAAFSLTLTETVGAGVVALPIALAGIGPLAGIGVLAVFGAVNVVTIVALVEAITRTGSMRYGTSYFGRLVDDLLGRLSSVTVTIALLGVNVLALMALATGFASVLSEATSVGTPVWVALLFAVVILIVRRESLDSTVASALVVGAMNLILIAALVGLGLAHVQPELLLAGGIPPFDGRALDGGVMTLVFGVVMASYFGHASAGNAAKLVLRRDPGGRSLLWGNVAAMVGVVAIYSAVVLAINGSVAADRLVGFEGTAITPLAEVAGPLVLVLGSLYVVLAMGMTSLHMALGIYNQTGELVGAWQARRPTARAVSAWGLPLLRSTPVLLVFIAVELMLVSGHASFSAPLSLVGALAVPALGGAFPMLLLAASRRRGECVPRTSWRVLGAWPVVLSVFGIYAGAVALHGLVIWDGPLERVAALLAALIIVVVGLVTWHRGAFRPRMVIELRSTDHSSQATLSVVATGRSLSAAVHVNGMREPLAAANGEVVIDDGRRLGSLEVRVPAHETDELKVWTHRIGPAGESTPWPSRVEVDAAGSVRRIHIDEGRDSAVVPVTRGAISVRLAPTTPEART